MLLAALPVPGKEKGSSGSPGGALGALPAPEPGAQKPSQCGRGRWLQWDGGRGACWDMSPQGWWPGWHKCARPAAPGGADGLAELQFSLLQLQLLQCHLQHLLPLPALIDVLLQALQGLLLGLDAAGDVLAGGDTRTEPGVLLLRAEPQGGYSTTELCSVWSWRGAAPCLPAKRGFEGLQGEESR